jgi:hypothetical protein
MKRAQGIIDSGVPTSLRIPSISRASAGTIAEADLEGYG